MEYIIKVRPPVQTTLANLKLRVATWIEGGHYAVGLDLAEIESMDELAVGALVRLLLECKNNGVCLSAYNLQPPVKQAIVGSGVAGLLGIDTGGPPVFETQV